MSGVVSSVIDGLFNTLNSGLSAVYNKNQQKRELEAQVASEQRQNQYNIEAEQRSLQYQKDLIDYTNEYNTPAAQAQRYAEAGYNPYLVDVDSGQMSAPNAVGADAATAQSGYSPDFKDTLGIDKFAEGAMEGLKYSLEKKKLAFEAEKLDVAKRQFESTMSLDERKHQFEKQMRLDEFAYRKTLDDINLSLKRKEISLAEAKEQREAAHQKFEEERETAQDELNLAKHNLSMRIGSLQYQKDQEEYEDVFPELKRNKKLKLQLENLVNDLSDDEKKVYRENVRKSEELRARMLDNDISFQEYRNGLYKLWDKTRPGGIPRYQNSGLYMTNPYEEDRKNNADRGALSDMANIALRLYLGK